MLHLKRVVIFSQVLRQRSFSNQVQVFDKHLKAKHRAYAMSLDNADYYDYLREESNANITDRLEDIKRSFPSALEFGSYRGSFLKHIANKPNFRGEGALGGITDLTQCDMVHCVNPSSSLSNDEKNTIKSRAVVVPDESLPFQQESFDLVVSSLALHWVNDLPGMLTQIKNILKPDGAFVASLLGGNTLKELRHCFYVAEQERRGGVSSHASPLARASDMAALMQSAGFALPTIDIDTVTISYPDAFTLMEHLVNMGEGSASLNRQFAVGRDTFLAMASLYQELYGLEDGSVTATFEIIYVIGWAPDASQPQACQRGTAKISFKEHLGSNSANPIS